MEEKKEKVLTVGIDLGEEKNYDSSMIELSELVQAAGGEVVSEIVQKRDSIHSAYFIGKGKASEIQNYCDELDIDTVVFNDELSGAQLRNLEEIIHRKIVDRTNLILDIFARRATSKEGKLQVKLAQLQYRLPRLVGFRDYLSREGAGIGTRGPGEQKLETDRRHIQREIDNIKNQLKILEKNRAIKRKQREDSNLPIVALVGYTNAGKSTLLNRLIENNIESSPDKRVFVKDMLFATLDTSLRRAKLSNGQDFLLTDTVGFVSKLPTNLIEAFKGTLEEVNYADLILHVVDASNEDFDIQVDTTIDILKDLDALRKPMVTVFNKVDKVDIKDLIYNNKFIVNEVFISAKENINIDKLLDMIDDNLPGEFRHVKIRIPFSEHHVLNYFMEKYSVEKINHDEYGTIIELVIDDIDYKKYKKFVEMQ